MATTKHVKSSGVSSRRVLGPAGPVTPVVSDATDVLAQFEQRIAKLEKESFSRRGFPGEPGKDGAKGERGEPGKDGRDGKDGTSYTVSQIEILECRRADLVVLYRAKIQVSTQESEAVMKAQLLREAEAAYCKAVEITRQIAAIKVEDV